MDDSQVAQAKDALMLAVTTSRFIVCMGNLIQLQSAKSRDNCSNKLHLMQRDVKSIYVVRKLKERFSFAWKTGSSGWKSNGTGLNFLLKTFRGKKEYFHFLFPVSTGMSRNFCSALRRTFFITITGLFFNLTLAKFLLSTYNLS